MGSSLSLVNGLNTIHAYTIPHRGTALNQHACRKVPTKANQSNEQVHGKSWGGLPETSRDKTRNR